MSTSIETRYRDERKVHQRLGSCRDLIESCCDVRRDQTRLRRARTRSQQVKIAQDLRRSESRLYDLLVDMDVIID